MITVGVIFLIISGTLAWFYLFSIYEVSYSVMLVKTEAGNEYYSIEPIPLNSMGSKALLRTVNSNYTIVDGKSRVREYSFTGVQAELVLNTDSHEKVIILAESEFSLFPTSVELE